MRGIDRRYSFLLLMDSNKERKSEVIRTQPKQTPTILHPQNDLVLNSDIFNQMSRVNNQQEEENIFKGSSFLDQKVIKKQFEEIENYK